MPNVGDLAILNAPDVSRCVYYYGMSNLFNQSIVQGGQHLVGEQFERRQRRKTGAVHHEIIHAQRNEGTHLFHDLLRRTHKTKVIFIVSAETVASETFGLCLRRRTGAATTP